MRNLRQRPSPALVISVISLFVALSGVAYGVAKNTIGSKQLKKNAVKSIDIAPNAVKGVDVKESTLGQVPDAAKLGGKGLNDVVMWAVISDDQPDGAVTASIPAQSGGISVTESPSFTNGGYRVTFPRSVANCAVQATAYEFLSSDAEGVYPSPGFAGVAPVQSSPNQVKLYRAASTGTGIDVDTAISAFC
jgi:hypothetical protein